MRRRLGPTLVLGNSQLAGRCAHATTLVGVRSSNPCPAHLARNCQDGDLRAARCVRRPPRLGQRSWRHGCGSQAPARRNCRFNRHKRASAALVLHMTLRQGCPMAQSVGPPSPSAKDLGQKDATIEQRYQVSRDKDLKQTNRLRRARVPGAKARRRGQRAGRRGPALLQAVVAAGAAARMHARLVPCTPTSASAMCLVGWGVTRPPDSPVLCRPQAQLSPWRRPLAVSFEPFEVTLGVHWVA